MNQLTSHLDFKLRNKNKLKYKIIVKSIITTKNCNIEFNFFNLLQKLI